LTENAGCENDGPLKREVKMQETKMADQIANMRMQDLKMKDMSSCRSFTFA